MTDPEPLPDELAGLFAAERSAPAGDGATRANVRARLASVVGLLPAKVAAAAGTATILGGTGKIIAVIAISIGAGVTAVKVARGSEPAHVAAPVIQPAITEETTPASPEQVMQTDERPHVTAPEVTAPVQAPAAPAAPAQPPATPPPSEAKLLKSAWSALASGDPARTLELAREAEHLYPGGVLVEERDALRILALAKLGLVADARAAARAFLVQFPRSVHRARVESVISSEEAP